MARIGLAASGTFTYGDQSFDGALKIKFTESRVEDEAQRTVIMNKVRIDVDFYCSAADFATLQTNIAEHGQVLVFLNKGFGNPINTGVTPDLNWGPKSGELTAVDMGGGQNFMCHWYVETWRAECSSAVRSGIIALNYEVTFTNDEYGLATRRISGYFQIAQSRGAGPQVLDSANNYLERLNIKKPRGYTRQQEFSGTADKSRVRFTIVDTPIRSRLAYPKTVIDIKGTHSFSWGITAAAQPKHVLSVEMVPVSGNQERGKLAVLTFFSILQAKLNWQTNVTFGLAPVQKKGTTPFLEGIHIVEDMFGLPVRCSAMWSQFLNPSDVISSITSITGQFIDIGTSWDSWEQNVADHIFGVRGAGAVSSMDSQQLFDLASSDRIVDPCNPALPTIAEAQQQTNRKQDPGRFLGKQPTPDPDRSYLYFQNWLETDRDTPVGQLKYSQPPGTDATTSVEWNPADSNGVQYPQSTGTNDVIYYGGRSSYVVEYCGQAVRAGYPVPRPTAAQLGAQLATERKGFFAQVKAATYFGVPVFAASWRIRYLLPGSPGNLQIPKSPTT